MIRMATDRVGDVRPGPSDGAAARTWHGRMALLCIGLLGAALLFGPGGPVASHHLPILGTCLVRALTHQPCPACGLTRSVALALRLDLPASAAMHPVGCWLALALVLGAGWFALTFLLGIRSAALWRVEVQLVKWVDHVLLATLLLVWVSRLALNAG
jgi:hypothetical protein